MKTSTRFPAATVVAGILLLSLVCASCFVSCATTARSATASTGSSAAVAPVAKPLPPMAIIGAGAMTQGRLVSFFLENNPTADVSKVERMAGFYISEASVEGVNADVAFIQMCLETGFLRFGGLVTVEMNNFCGLGSIGAGQPGVSFPDERTGVRAHVQHLKGYATAEPPVLELVDPRYKYVSPKGKAPLVQGLSGTWAADTGYGAKLAGLLARLYA